MNKLLCYNTLENLKGYQPILSYSDAYRCSFFLCYHFLKLTLRGENMETNTYRCKACGGQPFSEGKLDGYAALRPVNTSFSSGSPLIFTVCTQCGEIASIKATKPEKFK